MCFEEKERYNKFVDEQDASSSETEDDPSSSDEPVTWCLKPAPEDYYQYEPDTVKVEFNNVDRYTERQEPLDWVNSVSTHFNEQTDTITTAVSTNDPRGADLLLYIRRGEEKGCEVNLGSREEYPIYIEAEKAEQVCVNHETVYADRELTREEKNENFDSDDPELCHCGKVATVERRAKIQSVLISKQTGEFVRTSGYVFDEHDRDDICSDCFNERCAEYGSCPYVKNQGKFQDAVQSRNDYIQKNLTVCRDVTSIIVNLIGEETQLTTQLPVECSTQFVSVSLGADGRFYATSKEEGKLTTKKIDKDEYSHLLKQEKKQIKKFEEQVERYRVIDEQERLEFTSTTNPDPEPHYSDPDYDYSEMLEAFGIDPNFDERQEELQAMAEYDAWLEKQFEKIKQKHKKNLVETKEGDEKKEQKSFFVGNTYFRYVDTGDFTRGREKRFYIVTQRTNCYVTVEDVNRKEQKRKITVVEGTDIEKIDLKVGKYYGGSLYASDIVM